MRVMIKSYDASFIFSKGGNDIEVPTNKSVCIVDDWHEVLDRIEEKEFVWDGIGAANIIEKAILWRTR